ncbi:MAG: hypothetical protein R2879_00205 [Saprospiraceae bacterium]
MRSIPFLNINHKSFFSWIGLIVLLILSCKTPTNNTISTKDLENLKDDYNSEIFFIHIESPLSIHQRLFDSLNNFTPEGIVFPEWVVNPTEKNVIKVIDSTLMSVKYKVIEDKEETHYTRCSKSGLAIEYTGLSKTKQRIIIEEFISKKQALLYLDQLIDKNLISDSIKIYLLSKNDSEFLGRYYNHYESFSPKNFERFLGLD